MPYGVPPRGAGKAPPLGSGLPPPWALWVDGTGQACQRASSTQMGKGVEVVGGGCPSSRCGTSGKSLPLSHLSVFHVEWRQQTALPTSGSS